MRIVIQRVKQANVKIENETVGEIDAGLLLLVGISSEDTSEDIEYAVRKILNMRIFSDSKGLMNLNVRQIEGSILSISQFTLLAETKKGNRPSFVNAGQPAFAKMIYQKFNNALAEQIEVATGEFAEDMQVSLINDGPVTIILDTKAR